MADSSEYSRAFRARFFGAVASANPSPVYPGGVKSMVEPCLEAFGSVFAGIGKYATAGSLPLCASDTHQQHQRLILADLPGLAVGSLGQVTRPGSPADDSNHVTTGFKEHVFAAFQCSCEGSESLSIGDKVHPAQARNIFSSAS